MIDPIPSDVYTDEIYTEKGVEYIDLYPIEETDEDD